MKTNELRIGNHLFAKGREVIRFTSFFGLCNIESYPERYNPIPLTEEWFRKFHNEDEIEKSKRFPNEITIYERFLFIWKKEYKYWYVVTTNHKEYLTKIEFVHEYQNFIYALMDIELTILHDEKSL